jgi:hypothetical protein
LKRNTSLSTSSTGAAAILLSVNRRSHQSGANNLPSLKRRIYDRVPGRGWRIRRPGVLIFSRTFFPNQSSGIHFVKWRRKNIDYHRFFCGNGLISLRVEDEQVLNYPHGLIFDLIAKRCAHRFKNLTCIRFSWTRDRGMIRDPGEPGEGERDARGDGGAGSHGLPQAGARGRPGAHRKKIS